MWSKKCSNYKVIPSLLHLKHNDYLNLNEVLSQLGPLLLQERGGLSVGQMERLERMLKGDRAASTKR